MCVCVYPGLGRFPWRKEWLPTPVLFLHREFHGQRSLESYNLTGHKESDTTEHLTQRIYIQTFLWNIKVTL